MTTGETVAALIRRGMAEEGLDLAQAAVVAFNRVVRPALLDAERNHPGLLPAVFAAAQVAFAEAEASGDDLDGVGNLVEHILERSRPDLLAKCR